MCVSVCEEGQRVLRAPVRLGSGVDVYGCLQVCVCVCLSVCTHRREPDNKTG